VLARENYLCLRRWIDRDLRDKGKPISVAVAMLPAFAGTVLLREGDGVLVYVGILLCGTTLLGEAFIGWRAVRLIRAISIYSARRYERRDRYFLPPEYANSESSYLAKRRRVTPPPR
jgi:hypothetical protein